MFLDVVYFTSVELCVDHSFDDVEMEVIYAVLGHGSVDIRVLDGAALIGLITVLEVSGGVILVFFPSVVCRACCLTDIDLSVDCIGDDVDVSHCRG